MEQRDSHGHTPEPLSDQENKGIEKQYPREKVSGFDATEPGIERQFKMRSDDGRGEWMTRITPEMLFLKDDGLDVLDYDLIRSTGLSLRGLALASVGLPLTHSFPHSTTIGIVPNVKGEGRIEGFSKYLDDICRHIGMKSFVTMRTDVTGVKEAYERKADIVLLADDRSFIAYSTMRRIMADNSECTALGYIEAMDRAAGGISGKTVLIIGAGELGTHAIKILHERGCIVRIVESDRKRRQWASQEMDLETFSMVEEAVIQSRYILNASPAEIRGEWLQDGAVLSNPGVPLCVDELARRKAKTIVHNPLAIGTAVMLAQVLSRSRQGILTRENHRALS